MHAPSGMCLVCGRALGAEPHFIVEPPDGEHVSCRDWTRHPWPYEKLERVVRGRLRAIRAATAAVEELGRTLVDARASWPDRSLPAIVTARVRTIRELLERAGARLGTVVERDPRH